jgi:hypothetical protein
VEHKTSVPECYFPVYNIDTETLDRYNEYIFTGINSYNTIVKCPEPFQNGVLKALCEGDPKQIEDFPIVSDERGYVYRNKHCAKCNGVFKFISWNLKMKCSSSEDAIHFQNAMPFVPNNTCMLWSFPPKDDIVQRSLCFKANDECDAKGTVMANSFLQNACLSYTLYYFHQYRGLILIFKNVHCFACKLNIDSFLRESCPLMTFDQNLKTDTYLIPMTAFIDMEYNKDVAQSSEILERSKCTDSEIYDMYFVSINFFSSLKSFNHLLY